VGSHKKLRFQGRVIAATNRDLQQLRPGGAFRDDFYYRLCSDTIVVPTLRQRLKEDPRELDALLSHTVQYMVGMPSPELVAITQEVIAKRLGPDYDWPGNVRELEQCVRRVLLKHDYAGENLPARDTLRDELPRLIDAGALDADGLLSRYCRLLYKKHGTYEEVARRTNLDRRTVKKYIESSEE
jgi:transcriptional regulator with GAF, ATPase, and Fis domain